MKPEKGYRKYVSPSVWEDIKSVNKAETVRKEKNLAEADRLRKEILSTGWHISDTEEGPELIPISENY